MTALERYFHVVMFVLQHFPKIKLGLFCNFDIVESAFICRHLVIQNGCPLTTGWQIIKARPKGNR